MFTRTQSEAALARCEAATNDAKRIAALEAEVAEDQQEHDRLMAYVKQIKPDAHSVYEVLDSLKARCAQAERELASTKVSLAETTQSHHQLAKELREERARLAELVRVVKVVQNDTLDSNIVVKVGGKIQFLTLVLQAAIDAARQERRAG